MNEKTFIDVIFMLKSILFVVLVLQLRINLFFINYFLEINYFHNCKN